MNAVEIRKMLNNIKADFIGMGRPWHENDDSVIELLMSVYYQTAEIDWEEIKWLFINYLQKGILDFPTAKKMATKRLIQPSEIMEWIPDEEYEKANAEIASIEQQIAELEAKKKQLQGK